MSINLEELQKYLDDNNITLEEYMRANMITDEDRKYFDKIWMDANALESAGWGEDDGCAGDDW